MLKAKKINENQKRSENKTNKKGKTRPSAKALAKRLYLESQNPRP